jgi:hypothetical protein
MAYQSTTDRATFKRMRHGCAGKAENPRNTCWFEGGGCGGQLDRQPCLKDCTHLSSFYKEFDVRVKRGHLFRLSSSQSPNSFPYTIAIFFTFRSAAG